MMRLIAVIAALWGLLGSAAHAWSADDIPDKAAVRRQIEDVISHAPNHRATLGTICEAADLSISYGAPAWNAHDPEACCAFYMKTSESLCLAFAGKDSATAPARHILDDLKSALDRVKQSNDPEANAWTIRFVFDKTQAEAATESDRSARMLALGLETMGRSQFDDSVNAFTEAAASLRELDGQPVDKIPPECRYAPLAMSEALFAQKKYKEAAAAVEEGLRFLPELPDDPIDISKHFSDAAIYRLLFEDLRDAATSHPKDAGIQLLTGYHLFFTGHQDTAKPFFEKAIEIDPKDAAALRMMEQYDPKHQKAAPPPPVNRGNQA